MKLSLARSTWSLFRRASFLTILVGLGLSLNPSAEAQVTVLEDFDNVSPPNLPLAWKSDARRAFTPVPEADWKTLNALPISSAPNVARHAPAVSLFGGYAQLSSRYFRVPKNSDTRLFFDHRFAFESGFDGGKFFLGGQDSQTAVNCYDGGYTAGALSVANPIFGAQSAWTGTSPGFPAFLETACNISNLAGRYLKLDWKAGYDASVLALQAGWDIDSVLIQPAARLAMTHGASVSTALAGANLTFTTTVENQGPGVATNLIVRHALPPGVTLVSTATTLGTSVSNGTLIKSTLPALPAGFKVTITSVVKVGADAPASTVLIGADFDPLFTHEFAVRSLVLGQPFAATPQKLWPLRALDFVGDANDACEVQTYSPSQTIGRIALVNPGGCSLTTKALNLQAKGFAAAVVKDLSDTLSDPGEASPDVAIPVLLMGPSDFDILGQFSDQDLRTSAALLPSTLLSIANISADQYNPDDLHEYQALYLPFDFDQDGDSVGDKTDGCPADPAKNAAGVCGCGVADQDFNANGVLDCLLSPDLKAQLQKLIRQIKALRSGSTARQVKNFNRARKAALDLAGKIVEVFSGQGATLTALDGKSSLLKLAKGVRVKVRQISGASLKTSKRAAANSAARLGALLP